MAPEPTDDRTDAEEQAPQASAASGGSAARSRPPAKAADPAPEPEAPEAPEEATFPLARLLHPSEGPEILRCEWHTIVGAFDKELAAIKADASAAAAEMSKSDALARIEDWLDREVHHDNEVPA